MATAPTKVCKIWMNWTNCQSRALSNMDHHYMWSTMHHKYLPSNSSSPLNNTVNHPPLCILSCPKNLVFAISVVSFHQSSLSPCLFLSPPMVASLSPPSASFYCRQIQRHPHLLFFFYCSVSPSHVSTMTLLIGPFCWNQLEFPNKN